VGILLEYDLTMDKISLKDVLEVFSVPLSEEQAWAVCFQCAKCLQEQSPSQRTEANSNIQCGIFKGIESVIMCKDGTIERNDTLHTAGTQLFILNIYTPAL
jgi:hypothetical protein